MAQKQQTDTGDDVTAAALDRVITAEEYAGRKPLIPPGEYSPVTVNITRVKEFVNEDTGQTEQRVYINYTCPNYGGDLSAAHKVSFHAKAAFGKLVRAAFPGMTEAQFAKQPPRLRDLNGKTVKMIVDYDEFNGMKFNDFRFFPVKPA